MSEKEKYKLDYKKVCYYLLHYFTLLTREKVDDITPDDLKHAYLHFSKIIHPDKSKSDPESNEKFIGLKKAYDILLKERFPPKVNIDELWKKITKWS